MTKKKNNKKYKDAMCQYCDNLIAIGEGDHICLECGEPKMVLADYLPTDEYLACGGKHFVEG